MSLDTHDRHDQPFVGFLKAFFVSAIDSFNVAKNLALSTFWWASELRIDCAKLHAEISQPTEPRSGLQVIPGQNLAERATVKSRLQVLAHHSINSHK